MKQTTNNIQAERLINLGIDKKTASMFITTLTDAVPACTLVDLIELLPMMIIKNNTTYMLRMGKGCDRLGSLYTFFYQKTNELDNRLYETAAHNNAIDAAVEMLEWVNENKDTFDYVQ